MKIYFNASARGKVQFDEDYQRIVHTIKALGHDLLTESLDQLDQEKGRCATVNTDQLIQAYQDTLKHIQKANLVILEISTPSLELGYLMHMALGMGKPVVALYQNHNLPSFATLISDQKLQVLDYTLANLAPTLQEAILYASESAGTRYNFLLTPYLAHYLDWIAHNRKIPRAVYIRKLIEEDYQKRKEVVALV